MFLVAANTRQAIVGQKEWITTGSSGIQVQFLFSDDWEGLSKFAVFRNAEIEESKIPIALPESNLTELPAENCAAEYVDEKVYVGVYGSDGLGHIIIPTIWVSLGVLKEGAAYEGMDPPQPTPDMWAQILAIAQNAGAENAEEAEKAADEAKAAVTHYPKIVDGYWYIWNAETETWVNTGIRAEGRDGYSPEVTITEIEGGHRVTITDEDHPQGQTFDVMDGQGGSTGDYDELNNRPRINGHTLTGNQSADDLGLGTYSKPASGIPKTDLASDVKESLGKADTALQTAPVQSVAGKTGAVTLDAGDVGFNSSEEYNEGTVGAELSELNRQLSDVEENQIPELKSALTFESSTTRNTTTAYPLSWENGTLSSGQPVASGWAVRSPDFIEMKDGLIFTARNIQSGLRLYMAMYDSTKTFLTDIDVEDGTLTPTNENCKYVKLFTYSETTPQADQGSKISATITNNNSIERTWQTIENNKTEAFDYTSWLINDGVLAYKKSLTVGVNINNSGDTTYIYNQLLGITLFTGALIVYCESSEGSKVGSPIQISVMDGEQAFIKNVVFKSGVYPHVYVPAANEKYFSIVLYASGDGNLPNPAVFKNVLIAMNGDNIPTLNSAIMPPYRSVPYYYLANNYLPDKVATIKNLINASGGNYDAFVFCTDQHWTLNAKNSPNLINYLMYNLKMPRMFMGGDYGSGINLQAINAFRDAYDGEIVNVTGNHELQQYYQTEDGVVSGTVTGTMVWAYLDASMTDCVIGNAERNYYYIDNTQQKMRYIILNDWAKGIENTTPIYQFEQDQLDWFDGVLESLPDGYLAVVFIHAISSVNHETGALTKNYAFSAVEEIVDTYSTKVCCIIAGHTHFDGVGATDGGVPVIVTTCDKALPEEGYDDYLTDIRTIGTITEQAFDVFVINKKDKVIDAVRIGCPANNPTGSPLEVRTVTYGS